jgi:hypothetical protein
MRKMKCPNCGRRAFDISKLPKEEVEVTLSVHSAESSYRFPVMKIQRLRLLNLSLRPDERR